MGKSFSLSAALCAAALAGYGQISGSAYRALGQPDLLQNGANLVQGLEVSSPSGVAFDGRGGLYIADTGNHRVLGWANIDAYQNGGAPTVVLGQPGRQFSAPAGIGTRGLISPIGLAVNGATGDLYVADFGNNRVVRFPSPFNNPARVEPDAVYGQADFSRSVTVPTRGTLNRPRAVAFDAAGNLWVADAGNHRVVRFHASTLSLPSSPDADVVIGQRDFTSGTANTGGTLSAAGFDTPAGLAFDAAGSLYVSDFNNSRVLRFDAPLTNGMTAAAVWGQPDFRSRTASPASATTIAGPAGIAVDANRRLYVATATENRVIVFDADPAVGAKTVYGQADATSSLPNATSFPLASPNTLSGPRDVKVDPAGNVVVADTGNHRALLFPASTRTASKVFGQIDFTSNGVNQIKPASLNVPVKAAIDYSRAPFALYVADVANNRVLIWKDSTRFRTGDPADLVIGQPDLQTGTANVDNRGSQTPAATSLSSPSGLAVDSRDGTLYVADAGNNRVLRYRRPVSQPGRIVPDAVFGQTAFNTATSAAVSAVSMRTPGGVAIGPDGSLFVADTGNNRVLEFAAGSEIGAAAVRVYGQPNMFSSVAPARSSAQTLSAPEGVFVDSAANLYVADTGANRVLAFPNTSAAPRSGMAAAFVIGQDTFDSTATAGTPLRAPADVAVDRAGNIYIADTGNHRVLVFPALVFLPAGGATATAVIGQRDFSGTRPNQSGATSAEGLASPAGLFLDRQDTLYIADAENHRVVHFLKASSIVNAATFQAGVPVAPGALAALFGTDLADDTATVQDPVWPLTLAGREVAFNDEIRAPLQFVGPGQVNFEVPSSAPAGIVRVAVRTADTGELIAGGNTVLTAVSPGLFTTGRNGRGAAAALNQDGRVNSPANPASRGSVVTLFGTGQGQVSPPVADGQPAPSSPLSSTVTVPTSDGRACVASQPAMCIAIGNSFGEVQFSGLAPGFVGLWQINVRIPADIAVGDAIGVRVLLNGTPSNIVNIAVR